MSKEPVGRFLVVWVLMAVVAACSGGRGEDPYGDRDVGGIDDVGGVDDAGPERDVPTGPGAYDGTCLSPDGADSSGSDVWNDSQGTARVVVHDRNACLRSYTLSTTASLRHPVGEGVDNPRLIGERAGWPTVRTGQDMFDALYALTLQEVRECSVDAVRDYAFNDGASVSCGEGGCFETGRLWNYVWTRDTAYAVDLGLAAMEPVRSRNSLDFKLSERRGGGDLQIVQDTGSGGSYPVSTDRVAWAVGAWELLRQLDGTEREAFAARTYEALKNTIEHDRIVVWDPKDGLYGGEQSFLDWREQTYPAWTAFETVHLGMSKALNTNLLHYRALELAAMLAGELGDEAQAARYQGFADDLSAAIQDRLWLEDEGLFSTYIPTTLDPAPVRRYDLLGSAFAVLFGVATPEQSRRILESYPHYGPGAPVAWPQQQEVPIYHNRGEWPFVTAYWLRAAKAAGNDAVADRMIHALVRGAAVNLSNMENFHAATGAAWDEDGAASGPVVNSERQLWSVAAYLSMVHHTIFGLEAGDEGMHIRPYVTARMRGDFFAGTDTLVLNDYPYKDRRLSVVLHLPESAGTGALEVRSIRLNGEAISGDLLRTELLEAQNRIDVELVSGAAPAAALTERTTENWQDIYGPRTPHIHGISAEGNALRLDLSTEEPDDVTLRIYRDAEIVADGLPGTTTSWTDGGADAAGPRSPCYVVEATFVSSGNHSQHSRPFCWWGYDAARVHTIGAGELAHVGGTPSENHGRFHYEAWGDEGHFLTLPGYTASQSGEHLVEVTFGNGAGALNTGITCAVKRVVVEDVETNEVVGEGYLMMPHLGEWSQWSSSNFVSVELVEGRNYRIVVGDGERAVNMSAFEHFEAYTGGTGGRSGVFNRANVTELKVLAR